MNLYIETLWNRSQPAIGTPVETYLRSRGVTRDTPAIRCVREFHPQSGLELPVMLAGVYAWPYPEPLGLHRTYLRPDGSGKAEKQPNKKMLGRVKYGAAWLTPPGETLVIGEGIETCLSVYQATGLPTWAALSAQNMVGLTLPDLPLAKEIIIAADNDRVGRRYAGYAASLWRACGRNVRVAFANDENDFNDLLRKS